MRQDLLNKLTEQCYDMKVKALEMALSTGGNGSHIGGAFSAMEMFATLYEVANVGMDDPDRDRIIVSKGHCVLAYYTALWQKGLMSNDELATFDQNGTRFHGHPHRRLQNGIEFSGGSLGLGLSYAVGVALACKKRGLNSRVYVIVGDGECDEGIVWESLMSIKNYGLDNVTVIVDCNKFQLDGPTEEVMNQYSLRDKLAAFGMDVDVVNGHSIEQLYASLFKDVAGPRAIIAETVKANGISFLVNNKASHHTALSPKKYNQALEEIKQAYGKL